MEIPTSVPDFSGLIRWLAKTRHRGKVLPIAARAGVSSALVGFWAHGIVRDPKRRSVQGLCDAYGLDPEKVYALIDRQQRQTTPVMRVWDDGCKVCGEHQSTVAGEERERLWSLVVGAIKRAASRGEAKRLLAVVKPEFHQG